MSTIDNELKRVWEQISDLTKTVQATQVAVTSLQSEVKHLVAAMQIHQKQHDEVRMITLGGIGRLAAAVIAGAVTAALTIMGMDK